MGETTGRVNKKLLPIKGHYFFFNAGTAPVTPFLSIYAKQLGFSSFIVGIIYTVLPFSGMLCKPVAGAIADRFFIQKPMFLVSSLIVAAGFLSIYFAPSVPLEVQFSCDAGIAEFKYCNSALQNKSFHFNSTASRTRNPTCQLSCSLPADEKTIFCKQYTNLSYCGEKNEDVSLETTMDLNKVEHIEECVFFRINGVKIDNTQVKLDQCVNRISSVCTVECDDIQVKEVFANKLLTDNDILSTYQFWVFLLLMMITWDAMAIVVSVGDTICFELLGDEPNKYGSQRCYGALGWGVLVIITGLIVDAVSKGEYEKNYLPAFLLAFVILLMHFTCCCFIKYKQQVYETNIFKGVLKVLKDVRVLVFMAWCIYIGLCTGIMWNFFLWLVEERASAYSENYNDWIGTLQGILLSVQTLVGELPFFWLSGYFLRKLGHVNSMNLILFVFGIRFILYSVITNPWYYIPIEISNGFTFGIFYAAMTSYASKIAPPGAATTVQGLVGALFEGIGVSLGSLIAGSLMGQIGGALTFRYFGICSLVMCALHFLVQLFLKERKEEDFRTNYSSPMDALSMLSDDTQELQLIT